MSLESFMNSMRKLVIDEFAKKEESEKYPVKEHNVSSYLESGLALTFRNIGLLECVRKELSTPLTIQWVFRDINGKEYRFPPFQVAFFCDDLFYAMKEHVPVTEFKRLHMKIVRRDP